MTREEFKDYPREETKIGDFGKLCIHADEYCPDLFAKAWHHNGIVKEIKKQNGNEMLGVSFYNRPNEIIDVPSEYFDNFTKKYGTQPCERVYRSECDPDVIAIIYKAESYRQVTGKLKRGDEMDREKVIKAVEEAFDLVHSDYIGTYDFDETEWEQNKADALALLKEQEAKTVIKIAKRFNDCDLTGFCPFCSRPLIKDWAEKYCGYCGNPVLWEGR